MLRSTFLHAIGLLTRIENGPAPVRERVHARRPRSNAETFCGAPLLSDDGSTDWLDTASCPACLETMKREGVSERPLAPRT